MIKFIKEKSEAIEFCAVKPKDTFRIPNYPEYYMRLDRDGDIKYNTINLCSGCLMHFNASDMVYIVNLVAKEED